MHLFTLTLVLVGAVIGSSAKNVKVQVRQNVTVPCPGASSQLIRAGSIRFNLVEVAPPAGSVTHDRLSVLGADGQATSLQFPGCYRVQLSFELNRPLRDPYVEAFMQLGSAPIPCTHAKNEQRDPTAGLCTNITQTAQWCPPSELGKLRQMTRGKDVCRFCNICAQATKATDQKDPVLARYLKPEGKTVASCSTVDKRQKLEFQVCTPDRKAIHDANEDGDGKLEEYWQYLKQGVLTMVVHVADRAQPNEKKLRSCQRLCTTFDEAEVSESYRQTLQKTIRSTCTPQDEYVACVHHTMKFDVLEGF